MKRATFQSIENHSAEGSGFESELERTLRRIVRTVMRRGPGKGRLSGQILEAADSLPNGADRSREQVISQVGRKIYDRVIRNHSPASLLGIRQFETIHGRFDTATQL